MHGHETFHMQVLMLTIDAMHSWKLDHEIFIYAKYFPLENYGNSHK